MYEGPEPGGSERRAMGGDVEVEVGAVNMKVRVWILDVDVDVVVGPGCVVKTQDENIYLFYFVCRVTS
jgi:hypothetical protein